MKNIFKAIILATLTMSLSQLVAAAPPANDNWFNAEVLTGTSGTATGTTVDATIQPCEPGHHFPDWGNSSSEAFGTVWYRWVAPTSGSYRFSAHGTQGQNHATVSAYVFAPSTCAGNVVNTPHAIRENEYYAITGQLPLTSEIRLAVTAGSMIFIAIDTPDPLRRGPVELTWERAKYRHSAQLDPRNPGADLSVTRNTAAGRQWWFLRNAIPYEYINNHAMTFGKTTDKRLAGDYNGDALTDIVAARPENGNLTWWIADGRTGSVIKVLVFGLATDRPIAGDYDGDGIADVAVTRNENGQKVWHVLRSSDGSYYSFAFGLSTDLETFGDFDGDRATDAAVMRRNSADSTYTWYILRSSDETVMGRVFGNVGDIPQAADMDGDGKTDLVLFRREATGGIGTAGMWRWVSTANPALQQAEVQSLMFGTQFDYPQAGDYDGDGRDDVAVFRNGTWWIKRSTWGLLSVNFGSATDVPMTDLGMTASFLNLP